MKRNWALTIKEMMHLKSLGVDTSSASMCWLKHPNESEYRLFVRDEYCYELGALEPIPAFTLQDMLEMTPKELPGGYYLFSVQRVGVCFYYYGEEGELCNKGGKSFLEASYNMLCWLAENGYLGKEGDNGVL